MMRLLSAGVIGLTAVAGLAVAGLAVAVLSSGAIPVAVAGTRPAEPAGSWSGARDVPGVGGDWSVLSAMSCTTPGNCTAGGVYGWDQPYTQSTGFVVSETGGRWGKAADVPGISELDGSQFAAVTGLSCGWPGNCAAAGYYLPAAGATTGQAFVADEVGGTWRPAHPLPGITQPFANFAAGSPWTIEVSCAPAATATARRRGLNCAAGGSYVTPAGLIAFLADSSDGTWGAPHQVTGLAMLGRDYAGSHVLSVSCASRGNCAAGGSYTDDDKRVQAFAASEAHGSWRPAVQVPGIAALNGGGMAQLDSLDCPAADDCTAAGDYMPAAGPAALFVINQAGGGWQRAIQLPGSASRDSDGGSIAQVSCASTASCEVGGTLNTPADGTSGFIAGETRGKWGTLHVLPGTVTSISALSCPAPGQCAAGGTAAPAPYSPASGIVLDQVNGTWGKPRAVAPGDGISAAITALSCAAARACAAGARLPEGWNGGPWAAIATETPRPSPRSTAEVTLAQRYSTRICNCNFITFRDDRVE
jgi:hypothetical protein